MFVSKGLANTRSMSYVVKANSKACLIALVITPFPLKSKGKEIAVVDGSFEF